MADFIRIAPDQHEPVARVMMEELKMDAATVSEILGDNRIEEGELFRHRQKIGALPASDRFRSSRNVSESYAARVFGDLFFREGGLDKDFYADLYEETFEEAASFNSQYGEGSDGSIDRNGEVNELAKLLHQEVYEIQNEARKCLREAFAEHVEGLIQDRHVTVKELPGDIIHTKVTLTGKDAVPVALEPIKRFFTNADLVVRVLPTVAKDLFVRNTLVVPRRVEPAEANGVPLIPSTGFVIRSELYAFGPTPDPRGYIHIDFRESVVGGKKQVTITLKSLTEAQEALYKLPSPTSWKAPVRIKSLEGSLTLTEEEPGKTSIVFDVRTNPGLDAIPDFLIKSRTIGVPAALRDSARAIGSYILSEALIR